MPSFKQNEDSDFSLFLVQPPQPSQQKPILTFQGGSSIMLPQCYMFICARVYGLEQKVNIIIAVISFSCFKRENRKKKSYDGTGSLILVICTDVQIKL